MSATRIDHITTSGTFSLDGGTWEVENNVWLIGDDRQCVIIDAPHELAPIIHAVGDRVLTAILCTHAHDDHVTVAQQLSEITGAPVRLNPADDELWCQTYEDFDYIPIADGESVTVGDTELQVIATPGHAPGAVCYYAPSLGVVFTGDTLFQGGPGATGRSFSSFDTIIDSIRTKLLVLPPQTVVHTGHGGSTTIGDEAPQLADWIARGH